MAHIILIKASIYVTMLFTKFGKSTFSLIITRYSNLNSGDNQALNKNVLRYSNLSTDNQALGKNVHRRKPITYPNSIPQQTSRPTLTSYLWYVTHCQAGSCLITGRVLLRALHDPLRIGGLFSQ